LLPFTQRDSLAAYNEATAKATKAPQIVIEPPTIGSQSDAPKTNINENLNNCEVKNHTGAADEDEMALSVGKFLSATLFLTVCKLLS
jgi:hypothetical protein